MPKRAKSSPQANVNPTANLQPTETVSPFSQEPLQGPHVRRVQLAVNLLDLDRLPTERQKIADYLDTDRGLINTVEGEGAIAFKCKLISAALIIDQLRELNRLNDQPPIWAYISRDSGQTWKRIPSSDPYVVKDGDDLILNPLVFPPPKKTLLAAKRRKWAETDQLPDDKFQQPPKGY